MVLPNIAVLVSGNKIDIAPIEQIEHLLINIIVVNLEHKASIMTGKSHKEHSG